MESICSTVGCCRRVCGVGGAALSTWSFTGGALRQRAAKFTWKRLHVNLHFNKYCFTMSSNLKVCLQITKLDGVASSNMNPEKETQCCSPPSCCYACFGRHIKANCGLPAYNRPLIHFEHSLTWQCHCKVLQIPKLLPTCSPWLSQCLQTDLVT